MNADFPRILTLLRKERGISQKQAAAELQISQALLSHYEKGIRECGLDFVVRTADFYGVSCDYLLGRSPERTGAQLSFDDIPEPDSTGKENTLKGSILPTLNKKLVFNALNIIFDLLQNINSKELTTEVSSFMSLSVYRMFRILYGINPKNEQTLFTVSPVVASAKALATMAVCEANSNVIANELIAQQPELKEKLYMSTQTLQQDYPLFTTSLLNLIKNSETTINK
ncbi:helix-turn-helix transcriptional regulator [Paludicola sp. MB14-C6]|uniref:helix-turn-helix domain-containing protein n=1 Tax=Paludihabitans sp. MB14-C6 TaxID=3070656 RepID=UPI0027DC1553|nr:helix-turn-helix transcriptional regulator [Paludicola sp. MB14-C6]WMJ23923.1 helix-turn-helix transcriptional regulator [Paludicola sp. MB14-C6]